MPKNEKWAKAGVFRVTDADEVIPKPCDLDAVAVVGAP
jgi:hypothetical protein